MSFPTYLRAAALGLLLSGAVLTTSSAQEAKPEPTTCAGLTFEDPAGDQDLGVAGVNTGYPTRANLDIVAGFFRYAPDATGKNVLTANIRIANLDSTTESISTGHTYYFYFDLADGIHFVNAELDTEGAWTFGVGDLGISGTGNAVTGETTGKVYEGENGIISIVVPIATLGIEGKTLGAPRASSRVAISTPAGGIVPTADDGPDDQAGKAYKVTPCAETGVPTAPAAPGGPTPPPSTTPPPSGRPAPGPAGPAGPATLKLTVTKPKLSARKVARKRALAVVLNAAERTTAVSARLYRGSAAKPKVLATGKLAQVNGKAKLKLKVSKRKAKQFKRGTYTLEIKGVNAAGQAATVSVQIRVGK